MALPVHGAESIPCVSRSHADSLRTKLVIYQGAIHPLNTLATDFTLKVCGQRRPYGYSPEQVVASWLLYPDVWNRAPLILVDNEELCQLLGTSGEHIAISQLYDSTSYRLQQLIDTIPFASDRLQYAIREVDERVRLVGQLLSGQLLQPAPVDTEPLPWWKLQFELLNNRWPLFDVLYALLLLALLILFIYYIRR